MSDQVVWGGVGFAIAVNCSSTLGLAEFRSWLFGAAPASGTLKLDTPNSEA